MAEGFSIQFAGQPDATLGQAAVVEVYECVGAPVSFRLRYALDIAEGDLPLLNEPRLSAGAEIAVLVPDAAGLACLVKGSVRGQEIHFEHGGEGSTLEVLGADSLLALDREDKAVLWSNVADSDAVSSILGAYGFSPDVQATPARHEEAKHVAVQRETDLTFVQRLAARNGYLFWLHCAPDGTTETAHFKRPPFDDEPVAELIINLADPPANVGALDITWDAEAPASAAANQVDLNTLAALDGAVAESPVTALGSRRFAAIGAAPRSLHLAVPVDDGGDLRARGEGALIEAEWFARARGETTFGALGKVLRAHTIVKLRGAGSRHSGKWFCHSVRHTVDAVEHRMEFELVRNAWEEGA